MRVGNLLMRLNQVGDAIDHYRRAASMPASEPIHHWLFGATLSQLGMSEGKHELELARVLPLGVVHLRRQLGLEMLQRGNTAEAREEVELALRLDTREDIDQQHGEEQLAIAYTEIDPARSLNYWHEYIASTFDIPPKDNQERALQIAQHVYRARIAEVWKAGKFDDAVKLIFEAQELIPHDVEFALRYIGRLVAASRTADATRLFEKVDDAIKRILTDFPKATRYNQQLAWFAARSYRNLDDALKHAQSAITAGPESTVHLQTLAEVQFQRGQRTEAIKLIGRCVEREPVNIQFQSQLRRYESGSPGPAWADD
jgi:tetratricopeptide (TPR) repeat protein